MVKDLIDPDYGYCNLDLVNLLLIGQALPFCIDYEDELGGE